MSSIKTEEWCWPCDCSVSERQMVWWSRTRRRSESLMTGVTQVVQGAHVSLLDPGTALVILLIQVFVSRQWSVLVWNKWVLDEKFRFLLSDSSWRSNKSMLPLHWCSHLFPSSLTDFSDSGLSHKTLGTDYLQQMVLGSCWQSCWSGPRWCWTRGPGVEQEALIEHEQLMSCLLTCVSSSPWTCACYQRLVSSPALVVAECHHLALE